MLGKVWRIAEVTLPNHQVMLLKLGDKSSLEGSSNSDHAQPRTIMVENGHMNLRTPDVELTSRWPCSEEGATVTGRGPTNRYIRVYAWLVS
ncbi:hypothetical protein VNO77_34381 [Canavalia gladiata]|uniref:Uncharacterized protein n=1 Tax=Canavalia gladiata TaxID=3824 RepID=A0AAN9KG62_CANGL